MEPREKDALATERDEEKRSAFRERLRGVDVSRLVFVDETSTNVALTPRYAKAPRGERSYGKAPRNWGKNVSWPNARGSRAMSNELGLPRPDGHEATSKTLLQSLRTSWSSI